MMRMCWVLPNAPVLWWLRLHPQHTKRATFGCAQLCQRARVCSLMKSVPLRQNTTEVQLATWQPLVRDGLCGLHGLYVGFYVLHQLLFIFANLVDFPNWPSDIEGAIKGRLEFKVWNSMKTLSHDANTIVASDLETSDKWQMWSFTEHYIVFIACRIIISALFNVQITALWMSV